MKTTMYFPLLAMAGLTGCDHMATAMHAKVVQQVYVDANTRLDVTVEGAQTRLVGVPKSAPGAIHRVLEGADGKVLFAYDLEVAKGSADGLYHFRLAPSQQKPTFEKAREVTVRPQDQSVRVELMEKPGTGEKVVDVFSLKPAGAHEENETGPLAHLKALHNQFFHWVHGN